MGVSINGVPPNGWFVMENFMEVEPPIWTLSFLNSIGCLKPGERHSAPLEVGCGCIELESTQSTSNPQKSKGCLGGRQS